MAVAPAERALLHERIALRFEKMLQQGFISEVEGLIAGGARTDTPAMRAVGYRQVVDYLQEHRDMVQLRERGVIATRQFAKRQMTWLRGWPELQWLWVDEANYRQGLAVSATDGKPSIVQQMMQKVREFSENL
jgi:tRNA dimethylallyltransferase